MDPAYGRTDPETSIFASGAPRRNRRARTTPRPAKLANHLVDKNPEVGGASELADERARGDWPVGTALDEIWRDALNVFRQNKVDPLAPGRKRRTIQPHERWHDTELTVRASIGNAGDAFATARSSEAPGWTRRQTA